MKLLTDHIRKTVPALYATEETPLADKTVHVKFFTPWSGWTWYLIEYDAADRLGFGLVDGLEAEFGYFSLDELEAIKGPGGLTIERDIHFEPMTVREVVEKERIRGVHL